MDKYILKISTDSSSAGQQLNNRKKYENLLINKKIVHVLKKLKKCYNVNNLRANFFL